MKRTKYIIGKKTFYFTDEELEEYQRRYNPGFYNFFYEELNIFISSKISNGLQV